MNGREIFYDLKEKYLRLQIQKWTKMKVKVQAKYLAIFLDFIGKVGIPETKDDEEALRRAIVRCETIMQGFNEQLDQAKSLLGGEYHQLLTALQIMYPLNGKSKSGFVKEVMLDDLYY